MSATQILVVDDFLPWQRFVLELFASQHDLQIGAVAADGLDAVQKAKEMHFNLILMDLGLPGMNGIEATRQIRILSPRSKILFVSEHSGLEFVKAAFDVGASGYVLKSDSYSDLIPGARTVLLGQQYVSQSLANRRENTHSAK
jgi:DNA-binding NarL/FixJ family response regulator